MATQKGRNWSSGDIVTAANLSSIERGVSAVAEEYTPTTWANGDTVTAAALNNIEQGIANASSGDSWITLTEESVISFSSEFGNQGILSYSQAIIAGAIKVTFSGVEYECPATFIDGNLWYGGFGQSGFDFSQYPFALVTGDKGNGIYTETAGTYNIKIEAPQRGGGSSDFSTATGTFTIQNGASATITNAFVVFGQVGERYLIYREEIPFSAGIVTLPLVDGRSSFGIVPDSGVVVMVSGNAEYYSEDEEIVVTGDCTITISDSSGGETF